MTPPASHTRFTVIHSGGEYDITAKSLTGAVAKARRTHGVTVNDSTGSTRTEYTGKPSTREEVGIFVDDFGESVYVRHA